MNLRQIKALKSLSDRYNIEDFKNMEFSNVDFLSWKSFREIRCIRAEAKKSASEYRIGKNNPSFVWIEEQTGEIVACQYRPYIHANSMIEYFV